MEFKPVTQTKRPPIRKHKARIDDKLKVRLIDTWKESGLTQAEFCRQHNLTAQTFSSWRKQIAFAELNDTAGKDLPRSDTLPTANVVEFHLPNGSKLCLPEALDRDLFYKLVKEVCQCSYK